MLIFVAEHVFPPHFDNKYYDSEFGKKPYLICWNTQSCGKVRQYIIVLGLEISAFMTWFYTYLGHYIRANCYYISEGDIFTSEHCTLIKVNIRRTVIPHAYSVWSSLVQFLDLIYCLGMIKTNCP